MHKQNEASTLEEKRKAMMDLKSRKMLENDMEKKRMDDMMAAEAARRKNEQVDRLRSQHEYHYDLARQEDEKRLARNREKDEDRTFADLETKKAEL